MNRETRILKIKELVLLKTQPEEYYKQFPDRRPEALFPQTRRAGFGIMKSYSHKPYLAKMPYDRNSRNPYKMVARYHALEKYEATLKEDIDGFNKEFKDAMNLFHDCNAAMEENESAISYYEGELEGAEQESSKFDKYSIDWDEGRSLYEQKDDLLEYASENVLLDAEVAGNDPVVQEMHDELEENGFSDDEIDDLMWTDGNGREDDNAGHFVGLAGDYISQVYDDPLREIRQSLKENDGICTPETSQAIDDYIAKLEALDIGYEGNIDRRDKAIWQLRQLQANSPDEVPTLGTSEDVKKMQEALDKEWADWENTKKVRDQAKKDMINSKRKVHERNVALYEVANEKQNCSDVFDAEAGYYQSNSEKGYIGIKDYIDNVYGNLDDDLNSDGTYKKEVWSQLEEISRDMGYPL